MSSSFMRWSLGLLAWGGCVAAALSFANWPGDLGHGICGPWGCGPPLQALIACHTAWLVALVPPAGMLILSNKASSATVKCVGIVATLLGAAVLTILLVHQLVFWLPQANQWQRPYFWQKFGFTIATTVDVPVIQVLLVGCATWLSGRTRPRPSASLMDSDGVGRDAVPRPGEEPRSDLTMLQEMDKKRVENVSAG